MEQSPNCPNCGSNLIICSCTRQEREYAQRLKDSSEEIKNNLAAFKTGSGPEGARELLRRYAEDPTLEGVVILSLHQEDRPPQFSCNNVSMMERCFLETFFRRVNTEAL